MSEFVAGAFVDVKPDTRGFREDLRKKLNASIKSAGTFKIPIELDPKRFKSTVRDAARQTRAEVPIVPSTTVAELRQAIQAKVNSATKGLKINVPVEVVQTGAGSRGGGVAGAAGESAVTAQKKATTAATRELTSAEGIEAKVKAALKRNSDELAIAESLLAQSKEDGITVDEEAKRLSESNAAAGRARAAANRLLATSQHELTAAQIEALEIGREDAGRLRQRIQGEQKSTALHAAQTKLLKDVTESERALEAVRAIDIKQTKSLNALQAVNNELERIGAKLKGQTRRVDTLGLSAQSDRLKALQREVAAQKEAVELRRLSIIGESKSARQQRTAARGFASTGLSLLGVRGATLAASSAFLAGAVAAAIFAKAVKTFADLETQLNVFQATTGATATQMEKVAKVSRELGRDISLPGVSAADAAEGMTELARAGLSVEDSIAGAKGVLQLAAAAQISNADAATLAASALNAFGLEGSQAIHVADLLANAANAAQGSIAEMGAALQQASAIARQVGLSLNDTVAILTQFARNGLRGSDAGTSLRTALSRLIAPTGKANKLIEALGLNLRDVNGRLRADIFAQFGQSTRNLPPALRDMIAETIAGQDAIRAFAIGAREGARGLKLAQLQMEATGTAAQLAAARSKGLAGEMSALASNAETLGGSLGKLAAGPVKGLVSGLNDLITELNLLFSGDFHGFLGELGDDFVDMGRGAKQSATDFNDFIQGLAAADTDRAFKGLKNLLKGGLLEAPEDKEEDRVKTLQQELLALQQIRVKAFAQGFDIKPFTERLKDLQAQIRAANVEAGNLIPVTKLEKQIAPLQEIVDQANEVRKSLVQRGADTSFIDDVITDSLQKINKLNIKAAEAARKAKQDVAKAVSGSEIADSFTASFGLIAKAPEIATPEVLKSLDNLVRKIKGKAPLTGAAGREMGEQLLKNLNAAITAAVEEDNPELAARLKQFADKIAALFGTSIAESFKKVKLPLTNQQLADALLPFEIREARAAAFGGVEDQLRAKQEELSKLNKQLGQVVKGSEQEKNVLNAIEAKQNEIRSLRESQAQEQAEKDKAADDRIKDAISGQERGLLNQLALAGADESVKNDIRVQVRLRAFYERQIAIARTSIKDKATRNDAIKDLEQKLFDLDIDLTENRATRRDQIRAVRLSKLDAAAERAEETETLADDLRQARRRVKFWERQVDNLRELVKQRRASVDELKAARKELDDAENEARNALRSRREQKRETIRQSLELDIEFAQTTGNENAEVKARRRFIKFLENQKKFFKGNTIKLKELRNEIAEQKKAIADLKGEAESDKGTTVFDLLKQAADTFRENAGNLITGSQPFAGPTGFTADLAQFLVRQRREASKLARETTKVSISKPRPVRAETFGRLAPPSAQGVMTLSLSSADNNTAERNRASVDRLTSSIDRLTTVIERQPGTGKVGPKKLPAGIERSERNHFAIATATRRVVENRTSI